MAEIAEQDAPKSNVIQLYLVCFACNGCGKEPDYGGWRVCIWCEGKGRRRAKRSTSGRASGVT